MANTISRLAVEEKKRDIERAFERALKVGALSTTYAFLDLLGLVNDILKMPDGVIAQNFSKEEVYNLFKQKFGYEMAHLKVKVDGEKTALDVFEVVMDKLLKEESGDGE